MSLIADASFIRKGGVYKMTRLPYKGLTDNYSDATQFIFLVRPSLTTVEFVAEAIRYVGGVIIH